MTGPESGPTGAALLVVLAACALGTYLLRLTGVILADRVTLSARAEQLVARATTVLLTALVSTSTLVAGGRFAGPALLAGVLVGAALAWRRAPFIAVVVTAAATTALLRLAGLP